ncbi:hypothetical protein GcM1_248096 [Golovinomyces cichoracearum]|uniref:Uncharacterized protein n=1 Tax=Golovinomyces cichoracearum TaxID=62708 RepID=A0A420ICT9_9PEZI|nr:hypothetical protein GcM1_248096 [Golovinomyces cichoracearum]
MAPAIICKMGVFSICDGKDTSDQHSLQRDILKKKDRRYLIDNFVLVLRSLGGTFMKVTPEPTWKDIKSTIKQLLTRTFWIKRFDEIFKILALQFHSSQKNASTYLWAIL